MMSTNIAYVRHIHSALTQVFGHFTQLCDCSSTPIKCVRFRASHHNVRAHVSVECFFVKIILNKHRNEMQHHSMYFKTSPLYVDASASSNDTDGKMILNSHYICAAFPPVCVSLCVLDSDPDQMILNKHHIYRASPQYVDSSVFSNPLTVRMILNTNHIGAVSPQYVLNYAFVDCLFVEILLNTHYIYMASPQYVDSSVFSNDTTVRMILNTHHIGAVSPQYVLIYAFVDRLFV